MSSSQAVVKRDSETALMPPPPPPKRIKRPATVLDEDVYTDALSHIIARDYFPGLLETQVKQEYLDALDSKDKEWIASSRKKLTDLMMTPGRSRPRFDAESMTFRGGAAAPGDTPAGWGGDTPMSMASVSTAATARAQRDPAPEVSKMGLLNFQAKYTSEDNESFNRLLDKQNTKRREKYAWLWSGNKIPTARQIAHHQRETKRTEAHGGNSDQQKQVAIKTDLDARPAKPDGWKSEAENSLMFLPSSIEDSYETIQQRAEAASRAGPKRVVYQNTRLAEDISSESSNAPPLSPSISAIQDAIAGQPRRTETEASYAGGETPRVNGYAFVDEDEPEPEPKNIAHNNSLDGEDGLEILGPISSTPNPFEIRQNRHREDLHHRMVDRVARNKRAEKAAQTSKTPLSASATPRFASSPRLDFGLRTPGSATPGSGGTGKMLTPAAQKLLSRVGGTPRASSVDKGPSSRLKNMWTPTPRRQR
ncbi:nuclear protein DGCR14 [Aspergillus insuetus]